MSAIRVECELGGPNQERAIEDVLRHLKDKLQAEAVRLAVGQRGVCQAVAGMTVGPPIAPRCVDDRELLARLVATYTHDGISDPSLRCVLEHALAAHRAVPFGATVEIGTYKGGTALALLALLRSLYAGAQPLVATVDPYGSKPYKGGDAVVVGLYGDPLYTFMRAQLMDYPNHAHYLMEGVEFLDRMHGCRYWLDGRERYLHSLAFAFVDGDHDHVTVVREIEALEARWTRAGTRVVVDNVDKDPRLPDALRARGYEILPRPQAGAWQAVRVFE